MSETVTVTTPPAGAHRAADDDLPLATSVPAGPPPVPAGPPPVPAAPDSPLGSLRAAKAKIEEKLYIDIRVPRWGDDGTGPKIYVRYAPANPSDHQARIEKAQKNPKKPRDWQVKENAQMLITACMGVYAVEGDEPGDGEEDTRPKLSLREGDPHGEWTRFDPDLAESLGLDSNCGAVAVCRALFFTEADLAGNVNRLMDFSGVRDAAQTDFSAS